MLGRLAWLSIACLAVALLAAVPAAARQGGVVGTWEGSIVLPSTTLPFKVTFTDTAGALAATFDSPAQQAFGLRLQEVRTDGSKVHFELPTGGPRAIFDGQLAGDTISGTFEQGPAKGSFTLKRAAAAAPAPPPAPLPYNAEEVRIQGKGVTLAGTLTIPKTPGKHPAVVLITGSGAEDRDENLFGFKIFGIIADRLTRDGIAVLRCDDRGVGGSSGSTAQSTSADFADDVEADIAFLKTRTDIDARKIGLLGHSEGGLIAPMVASRSKDVAFVVLMSGPAVSGEKILVAQGEALARVAQIPPDKLEQNRDLQQRLFKAVRAGGPAVDDLENDARKLARAQIDSLPPEVRKTIGDPDKAIETALKQQFVMARSPWFKFFLDYDPTPSLEKLTCPVLALFGGKDLQVPLDQNRPALEQALARAGNKDVTIKVFPPANHLYQAANTGGVTEYATLPKEFVPGFLDTVASWMKEKTR